MVLALVVFDWVLTSLNCSLRLGKSQSHQNFQNPVSLTTSKQCILYITAVTGYEEIRQLIEDFLSVSLKAILNLSMQTSVTSQGSLLWAD